MALEQHFADGGGAAEISVDLEWRVEAEQIVTTPRDEKVEEFVGPVAIVEAGPKIRLPGH